MRGKRLTLVASIPLLIGALSTEPGAEPHAYRIVAPKRALSAGEKMELKVEPPLPLVSIHWAASRLQGCRTATFSYHAPYVIPPGTPPATVRVSLPGERDSVQIELISSSVPGAMDCLGPGQSFATDIGDVLPEGDIRLVRNPIAIGPGNPRYPREAFVRSLEDTIVVRVLVCRTGRPLDAFVQPFCDQKLEPIPYDPKLGEAAVEAVMENVFEPERGAAGPIAAWIFQYVVFRK